MVCCLLCSFLFASEPQSVGSQYDCNLISKDPLGSWNRFQFIFPHTIATVDVVSVFWLPRCRQLSASYIPLVSHVYILMGSMIHTRFPFFLADVFVITTRVAAARTSSMSSVLCSVLALHDVIVELAARGDIQDLVRIVYVICRHPVVGIMISYTHT